MYNEALTCKEGNVNINYSIRSGKGVRGMHSITLVGNEHLEKGVLVDVMER